jgi:hypothetical protein
MAVVCGILIWNHIRERETPPPAETARPLPEVSVSPPPVIAENVPSPEPKAPDPSSAVVDSSPPPQDLQIPPGSTTENPAPPQDAIDPSEDLSAVDSAIRDYHAVHGENPIGSNAEITTALFINNPKQIKLQVPAGSTINNEGQLCDRWGTPYFFHQLSASEMQIRSAGPDREMWTGDDSQM